MSTLQALFGAAPSPFDVSPAVDQKTAPSAHAPLVATVHHPGLMDHEREMADQIEEFDRLAWSADNKGLVSGWTKLDAAFDGGWTTSWVLIGGTSNIGKTSFLSQLLWSFAQHNPDDCFVLDFSLDDPMRDKMSRVVAAANRVIINAVKNPTNYNLYPEMLKRRAAGLEKIRSAVSRYRCYDANHGTDIDAIEETIKRYKVALAEEAQIRGRQYPRKLVVGIDNFHDLTTTAPEARAGDKNKYDYLAQRVKDISTRYDLIMITTGEFRKLNGFRRPTMDDLRESVKIIYEASAILCAYSEVGVKGEASSVYFERDGVLAKCPVFELSVQKNKLGGYKGRLFWEFYPELAHFDPADDDASKTYNNLIYANE